MANEAELREYLRKAARELRQAQQRLREFEERSCEPIAIVGMACRYPGGIKSPEDMWRRVIDGQDLVSDFPTDRGWVLDELFDDDADKFGKSYVREGGFLDAPGEFDSGFFGFSAREATATDPQQRQLLEVAWESLERARLVPNSLRGTATGVFVGMADHGYGSDISTFWEGAEAYFVPGRSPAMAAGRIAYFFALEGPAITIDTACSSSLVALHQAVRSLRSGETSLALVGGATIMAMPLPFVAFSRQRALARNGRCKAFSHSADGTGWGEGVGMLVLERLSDAQRRDHAVNAVIRGSAVNQDGASNGITAPNGTAQQRVIWQALEDAQISAEGVDVLEGHGTGTVLGDPIEVQALLATYGKHRPATQPLWLGTVKSNICHTQWAAGIAGVIKMVEAIRHAMVPPTLHVDEPTRNVDWSEGAVQLCMEAQPWSRNGHPRRAGVSSFGISGTNAHLILEEYGQADQAPTNKESKDPLAWVLSARSAAALRGQAASLMSALQDDRQPGSRADIGYSLATTRTTFDHRAAIVARDHVEYIDGLRSVAEQKLSPLVVSTPRRSRGKTAFLFPGQGSQRLGMGRQLYTEFPSFASSFDEICQLFDDRLYQSLREVIFSDEEDGAELLDQTDFTQPALFTVEVALFRLLESWGLTADFVVGHSIGELAAAHVTGALSLPAAVTIVAERGRLMQGTGPGAMISIRASFEEVAQSLAGHESEVAVAASNAPNSTVISGDEAAVLSIAKRWRERGRRVKRLAANRAFHSPLLDNMLDEFGRVVAGTQPGGNPTIPVVSDLTGELAPSEQLRSSEYWIRQAREPVKFYACATYLLQVGVTTFLEVGPGDVLSGMSYECIPDDRCVVVPVLRPGVDEVRSLTHAVANVWVRGADVNWGATFAEGSSRTVDLPTYAFQRQHYWLGTGIGSANERAAVSYTEKGDEPAVESMPTLMERLSAVPEVERENLVLDFVTSEICQTLGELLDDNVDVDATIFEIGLTSLSTLELRSRLNSAAGTAMSLEDFSLNPTPRALAKLITELSRPDCVEDVAAVAVRT